MKNTLARYQQPEVAEHLASQYVLGQLSILVTKRLERLRLEYDYKLIDERISYWEQKLSPLNEKTPELAPSPQTWKNIQKQLKFNAAPQKQVSWVSSILNPKWFGAISFACCLMFAVLLINGSFEEDPLSYVAVMETSDNQPQMVAATYGNSKNLVLDIIELPEIAETESFELWVTSKTDNQIRSLGQVPKDMTSFQRQLSEAEWRLIKDSSYLILSIEEEGGSPIGEPSELVVSRGLCIRLSAWDAQS